jgi:hypothetical protein
MAESQVRKVVAIVLIIAGAALVLWVLVMWMMPSMMGGTMGGGMMGSMNGCTARCTFGPLLLAAVLVILGVVLLRNGSAINGDKI